MIGYRPLNFGFGDQGEPWKVVDRFRSTYWSGVDARYYFNNIQVEDVIQCNYQIIEQVTPHYGYASHTPDRMRHGTRLVVGEITLNFKRDGFLFSLLAALRTQGKGEIWLPSKPAGGNAPGSDGRPVMPATITPDALAAASLLDADLSPEKLRQAVDNYKRSTRGPTITKSKYPAEILRGRGAFETRDEGFDLNIIFGSVLRSGLALEYDSAGASYTRTPLERQHEKEWRVATGRKLVGVSLMTSATHIDDSGRNVLETYTFQARDVQILSFEDLGDPGEDA